jgi:iron-sulfur cluster repair protein YtfE (RIC family)
MEQAIESFMQDDHESLGELLENLNSALDKTDLIQTFRLLDLFWARLAVHIRAENICLFPAILNAPRELFASDNGLPTSEEVRKAITSLRSDHNVFMNELTKAVKTLRRILQAPEDVDVSKQLEAVRKNVSTVGRLLKEHNELEESAVYQWPRALLTPSELARLNDVIKLEIDNLPARFAEAG